MAKLTPHTEFDEILKVLSLASEGLKLNEILSKLSHFQRYTLQRRLALLIKTGKVFKTGNGRAIRYHLSISREKEGIEKIYDDHEIPLSPAAKSLRLQIIQPEHLRTPVNYNRQFLDQYQPNITSYLSEAEKIHLYDMGKTTGGYPAGTYARQMFNRLLIDLSWNSSRLEGNTYSLLETERLLKLGKLSEGKEDGEARMLINHKDAIEFLVEQSEDIKIDRYTILNLHGILSNDLLGDLRACGRLRTIPIGISKSVYNPLAFPQLIEECFQQILNSASLIKDPFEQAFFLMVHLPYLQPFDDVNKRVSRLAANIPLIIKNLCPLSFIDVPRKAYVEGLLGIYELNRIELMRDVFIWAYERSCLRYSDTRKELGEPDPFRMRYRKLISEAVSTVVRGCMNRKEAIESIRRYAHEHVPINEHNHYVEAVENDIMSLHEGNIGRHRLRPSEYEVWLKGWETE